MRKNQSVQLEANCSLESTSTESCERSVGSTERHTLKSIEEKSELESLCKQSKCTALSTKAALLLDKNCSTVSLFLSLSLSSHWNICVCHRHRHRYRRLDTIHPPSSTRFHLLFHLSTCSNCHFIAPVTATSCVYKFSLNCKCFSLQFVLHRE